MVIKRNKRRTSGEPNTYRPVESQAESMESSLESQEAEKLRRQAIVDLEELVTFQLLLGYNLNFEHVTH